MKVGTYTKLTSQLLGIALLWTSSACGSRTPLSQEEDAGTVKEDESAQRSSSGGSGGRAGSSVARAGRGSAGAGGMAGRAATGRGGRGGQNGTDEMPGRGGSGGRSSRDAAADSDDKDDEKDNENAGKGGEEAAGSGGEQAGSGGEQAGAGGEQAGAGGEQAGAGGEQAGAGGEAAGTAGVPAAGSGEQAGAGAQPAPVPGSMTQLTPQQITELCGRIDTGTASLPWGDAIRGSCARRGLATPEMCAAIRDMCVDGPEIIPVCTQTAPDCPNISIDEFVRCRIDMLYSFIEYNRVITCESMQPLPPEPGVPSSCVSVFERCPAAQAIRP